MMVQFGMLKQHTLDLMNLTTDCLLMVTTRVSFGHLVDLLMAKYRYRWLPTTLGKGHRISNPQIVKDYEVGIIFSI
jgi:hypothetical protein